MTSDRIRSRSILITWFIGAAGSLALMFQVGQRDKSILLMTVFAIWVLSPFAGLAFAEIRSKRWSAAAPTALHITALAIALGSLALYADVAFRPRPKPASMFLLVPAASWIVIAITWILGTRQTRPSQ